MGASPFEEGRFPPHPQGHTRSCTRHAACSPLAQRPLAGLLQRQNAQICPSMGPPPLLPRTCRRVDPLIVMLGQLHGVGRIALSFAWDHRRRSHGVGQPVSTWAVSDHPTNLFACEMGRCRGCRMLRTGLSSRDEMGSKSVQRHKQCTSHIVHSTQILTGIANGNGRNKPVVSSGNHHATHRMH